MSKKPLLSESQVAKWMKLANIDQNAAQNFLTENKKNNKKLVKENYGGGMASYAREDDPEGMEDVEGMEGEMGDGAMGDLPSVEEEEPMEDVGEEMGTAEGEVEFDSVEDLQQVLVSGLASESGREALKNAVMDALSELGLADEMGGEEDMADMPEEEESEGEGDEGGDEPAGPALQEEIEVLTDDEVINEVLKRVVRKLV